jgi:hypothetical protein
VRSPGPSMAHRRLARRIPFVVLRVRGDKIYWGRTPVRDASAIPRNRTRASCTHAGCASHPSAARFSQVLKLIPVASRGCAITVISLSRVILDLDIGCRYSLRSRRCVWYESVREFRYYSSYSKIEVIKKFG